VRGYSDFGFSYVYVIFQDLYWACSRVLEYLSKIQSRLPEGVRTELGPGCHWRRLGLTSPPRGLPRAGKRRIPRRQAFRCV
jgi:hypothetical protein